MTLGQTTMSRIAIESGRVRWAPRMRDASTGCTVLALEDDDGPALLCNADFEIVSSEDVGKGLTDYERWLAFGAPDLNDPPTLGCILQQAREAYDDPGLHTIRLPPKAANSFTEWWQVIRTDGTVVGNSPTEGEALLDAIYRRHKGLE